MMPDDPKPTPEPSPSPTPAPEIPTWRQGLPESIRGEKVFDNVKDVSDLATQFVNAQKFMGGSVRIPGESAKPEEWSAFWGKLGRPESPDKYDLKRPEVLPEGVSWDTNLESGFRKVSHDLGLTARQAQGLMKWHGESLAGVAQQALGHAREAEATLREEWGPGYDKNLAIAKRALTMVGGDEMSALVEASGFGNHPTVIKFFHRLGAQMSELGVIPGHVEGALTADQAKQKIHTILGDSKHAYWQSGTTAGQDARAEMENLYRIAYPGGARTTP